jgi:Flp pilus assembly pilin Flp
MAGFFLKIFSGIMGMSGSSKPFFAGCQGATAIEYALMVAAFALAVVAVVFSMGDELVAMTRDIVAFIQGREEMS